MQTHRIPQHVTGYQGRIMGKLSAKQFIYVAVGGILIFIIMTTFPFSLITLMAGVMIAFVSFVFALFKIQDRSIDEWLINFVIALQSTPQLIWLKQAEVPEILLPGYKPEIPRTRETGVPREKMEKFVRFWRTEAVSELTEYEEENMERLKRVQGETATQLDSQTAARPGS